MRERDVRVSIDRLFRGGRDDKKCFCPNDESANPIG